MTRAALVVLLVCVMTVGVLAATFGRTDFGAGTTSFEGLIYCGLYAPGSNGTATNISWYSTQSSTQNSKAAIYADVDGTTAGAKLAESSEDAGAADANWRTGTITLALVSGTNYWLCAWAAAEAGTATLNTTGTGGVNTRDTATYGTWPDPLVDDSSGTLHVPIYVTYTETSGGQQMTVGSGLCGSSSPICGN